MGMTVSPRLLAAVAILSMLSLIASCGGGGGGGSSAGSGGGGSSAASNPYFPEGSSIPASGPEVPGSAAIDQAAMSFMRLHNVPGMAVALAKDGKLLLARGYGYADFEARQPVQPDSRFRVASVSKMVTTLAIMRLRDQGQLDLDQPFLGIINQYQVGPSGDARLRDVTLRQMLQHMGGWDRNDPKVGDIAFASDRIAQALGTPRPASSDDLIRYVMNSPLQFTPGTQGSYSNIGFIVLGRVIEKISGQSYESYAREQVLAPLGIHSMAIAGSHASDRSTNEARYYPFPGEATVTSDFPTEGKVPAPYAVNMARIDAAGSWVASAIDLTRLMTAYDATLTPGFLTADSIQQMKAHPPTAPTSTSWYGLGLTLGPTADTYSHSGTISGTAADLLHDDRGYVLAVILNTVDLGTSQYTLLAPAAIQAAFTSGIAGSETDLYLQYPSPVVPANGP